MHILQLIPRLDVGGVERGVLDIADGLVQRGHRVSVVSAGGALVEPLTARGAMHYTLPVDRKSPWAVAQCVPFLRRIIADAKVDVVHARSRVPAWSGYVAARQTGVPFVTTCHGFYSPHPASHVMTWGRVVIVPSEALGRYLIDRFGVPPERLRVIPRGVDLARFPQRPAPSMRPRDVRTYRIGIIGRITGIKGHEVAIQAVHRLLQQGVTARLAIIGDAPPGKPQLRARLERLASTLRIEHAIDWMGTRHDIPEQMAACDLVLAPSTYPESFGRAVVEAQAIGVPVVASNLGGLAEVIRDGETGLLVPAGDPVALAQAIRRLIDEPELGPQLGQRARQRVEERYTLDRMVEQTEAVYEDCLTKPRIVVWKLGALGDVVLASPSLRAIRKQFPGSPISLVVGAAAYEAVAGCPYVDEMIVYDTRRKDRSLAGKLRFVQRLRRASFDRSIDLQNSRLTHALAWLADIPMRIGYARRWSGLLSHPVPLPPEPMHPVAHQHVLLRAAGIEPDGDALELWPSEHDDQRVVQLCGQLGIDVTKPMIGVHPGGSRRWVTKRWDITRWAQLCDRLESLGYQVVVTGDRSEQALGRQLLALTRAHPFVLIGKTRIGELACLIKRCRAFVTHDTAPLHLAAAVGTPVVALFGPTDPMRHVVPLPSVVTIRKPVFCSPCYSPRCKTVTHACMKRISVDEVGRATDALVHGEPIDVIVEPVSPTPSTPAEPK